MQVSSEILDWLLEPEDPSVRYFTLLDLLDQPPDAPGMATARKEIMASGDVPRLLEGQAEGGYWGKPEAFYIPRYTGAAWRFMLLAEFGADGSDPRIRKTGEHLFERSQLDNGGFTARDFSRRSADERGLLCLTGNMIWSCVRLGYFHNQRVQRGVDWILRFSRFDDGEVADWPAWLPQDPDDGCWGRHTCFRGAIALLQALAEIPPGLRSPQVQQTLATGAEYLLIHHLYKHSHDLSKPVAGYERVGFPLFVDNDLLRMLLFLTKLGVRDGRMQEALDCLARKQNKSGQWKQQHIYPQTKWNGHLPIPVTEHGQPSKWVTLKALTVMKRFTMVDVREG